MKSSRIFLTLLVTLSLGVSGCATDGRPMTNTQKGAIVGAAGGAVLGAIASRHKSGSSRKKAVLIGAVGGGIAGTAVGAYMDKQRQDLEKVLAAERNAGAISVEKLQDNALRVTMTDQTAFEVNSAQIKPGFNSTMDKIADVVNRYGKTTITIVGHTDNTGSDQYNQALSERRAAAVQNYFTSQKVLPERLESVGRGETEPRASNNTDAGRRLNRRVELYIEPIVAES
jgi:outer membrane protein OmpA-like peptidoglycan-associated protein